jgi:hypothetical protein
MIWKTDPFGGSSRKLGANFGGTMRFFYQQGVDFPNVCVSRSRMENSAILTVILPPA